VAQRLVVAELGGGAAEADGALLEDVDAVGEGEGELDVLTTRTTGRPGTSVRTR
jgi:hypothetical protein